MDFFIKLFGDIKVSDVITFIAAMVFVVPAGIKAWKDLMSKRDSHKDRQEKIDEVLVEVKEIKTSQATMKEEINELKENQKEIMVKQDEFENKRKLIEQNQLRDKLLQSYGFYTNKNKNPMLAWTELEKETFDRMFKDYEERGGNGYMHTEVRPKMLALTIILMSDTQGIVNLYNSRKG